jgi:hypothetical protein
VCSRRRRRHTYLLRHPDIRACIKSVDDVEKDLGANHAQVMIQVKLEDPKANALAVVKRTFQPFDKLSTAVTTLSGELEQFARTADGAAFAKAAATPPAKLAGGVLAILSLYRDFVVAALKGGTNDVASISGAVALLEGVVDSGRAGGLVAKAAGFSELAGRVAAGVGVVTSAIQLLSDLDRYEGDRLLHLARIAADAAALQASIVAVAGLSSLIPVAGTIVLLTQTVLVIAEYWHNHEVTARRNADTKAVLRKIGLAGDVSDTLADADNATLRALTQRRDYALALAPNEVQRLATLAQQVSMGREAFFLLPDNPGWVASAAEVARIWNLSSDSSFVMLRELSGKDGTLVRVVFDGCVPAQSGVFANKQGLYDAITTCRKGAAADERAALDRLASFLHAH